MLQIKVDKENKEIVQELFDIQKRIESMENNHIIQLLYFIALLQGVTIILLAVNIIF